MTKGIEDFSEEELKDMFIDCIPVIKLRNERNQLKQEKDNLIRYLEDKINEVKIGGCSCETTNNFEIARKAYQDILERVRNNNYE